MYILGIAKKMLFYRCFVQQNSVARYVLNFV